MIVGMSYHISRDGLNWIVTDDVAAYQTAVVLGYFTFTEREPALPASQVEIIREMCEKLEKRRGSM